MGSSNKFRPALGGEPIKRFNTEVYFNGGNTYVQEVEFAYGHLVKYKHHTDYIAPLQAEIERLKTCIKNNALAAGELVDGLRSERDQLKARCDGFERLLARAKLNGKQL